MNAILDSAPATHYKMTFQDFGDSFEPGTMTQDDVPPEIVEADVPPASVTDVGEPAITPPHETVTSPTAIGTVAPLTCDALDGLAAQIVSLRSATDNTMNQLAALVSSTLVLILDTLACTPQARPHPVLLPQMLELLQTATNTRAPLTIFVHHSQCDAMRDLVRARPDIGTDVEVVTATDLQPGQLSITWPGSQAKWDPAGVLGAMADIFRQYGLHTTQRPQTQLNI